MTNSTDTPADESHSQSNVDQQIERTDVGVSIKTELTRGTGTRD